MHSGNNCPQLFRILIDSLFLKVIAKDGYVVAVEESRLTRRGR